MKSDIKIMIVACRGFVMPVANCCLIDAPKPSLPTLPHSLHGPGPVVLPSLTALVAAAQKSNQCRLGSAQPGCLFSPPIDLRGRHPPALPSGSSSSSSRICRRRTSPRPPAATSGAPPCSRLALLSHPRPHPCCCCCCSPSRQSEALPLALHRACRAVVWQQRCSVGKRTGRSLRTRA